MDYESNRPKYKSIDGFLGRPSTHHPKKYNNPAARLPKNPNLGTTQMNGVGSPHLPPFPRYYSPHSENRATTPLSRQKIKKKWSRKKKVVTSVLTILVIFMGFGTYFGSRIIGNLDKVFHGNIVSDVQALFNQTKLNGESSGRVNILLAGYQGSTSDEGPLTDSIMVVSIDTQNNTALTISIPRDLWVNIPGMGHTKINAANTNTTFNQPGYFSGGMGQLQQVIETKLGIPINYYALIDYTAFEDAVNAVGGITVNIQSPDPRGLYDPNVDKAHGGPLKLTNGPVTLNGMSALALALARGDSPYAYGFPLSDINRTQHQRQMLIALEQKAANIGTISNPLTITRLVDSIGNNVTTNLTLPDVLRLAQLTKAVNTSNIKSYGLSYGGSNPLLTNYTTPDGQDALIPLAGLDNFSQVQHYYLQLTSSNPVVQENATVAVLNASNVTGLAAKEAAILTAKGYNVVDITDATNEYPSSMIVDSSNNKKPASKQLLEQLFSTNTTTTTNISASTESTEAQGYNANFVVILGQNWDTVQ